MIVLSLNLPVYIQMIRDDGCLAKHVGSLLNEFFFFNGLLVGISCNVRTRSHTCFTFTDVGTFVTQTNAVVFVKKIVLTSLFVPAYCLSVFTNL